MSSEFESTPRSRLLVLAGPSVRAPRDGDWSSAATVRLSGVAPTGEPYPDADLIEAADRAAERVRARYPVFLHDWARDSGALSLARWCGVSWWWYTPVSEKSPLRLSLVEDLYRLALFAEILRRRPVGAVRWHGDDPVLASAAAEVARSRGISFESRCPPPARGAAGRLVLRRVAYLALCLARRAALRMIGAHRRSPDRPRALLFTRFPILWEQGNAWRERMFGDLPERLRERGHPTAYAALCSAGPGEILRRRRRYLDAAGEHDIVFLDALPRLAAVFRAHLAVGFWLRYALWRRKERTRAVVFEGVDVSRLLWRAVDESALGTEVAQDRLLARAISGVVSGAESIEAVFHPFEYQPMERALWAGVKSVRDVPVVGIQTALYCSNQMGFDFPVAEVRSGEHPDGSPIPDYIAAYGERSRRGLGARLGADRICASGPIRYAGASSDESLRVAAASSFPPGCDPVLVPTPLSRTEAASLLTAAFEVAGKAPEMFLVIKFHYHSPMAREVESLAARTGVRRFAIVDFPVPVLSGLIPVTVCAGSSVGIEAIRAGSMPVVYRTITSMSMNPMLEVPDAVYFWSSPAELQAALESCADRDEAYQIRRKAWPEAIRAHMAPLDDRAGVRLCEFVEARLGAR